MLCFSYGWSQGPLVEMDNYLTTDMPHYFSLSLHVTEICEIPLTRAITFVQFLPIIKEKGLGFIYQARSNRLRPTFIAVGFLTSTAVGGWNRTARTAVGVCVQEKARGEVARAQSAPKGTLGEGPGWATWEKVCAGSLQIPAKSRDSDNVPQQRKQSQW